MTTTVFPAFRTSDAHLTLDFLQAAGFTRRLLVPAADDPERIEHAEYDFGPRGGVMFGSLRGDDSDAAYTGARIYVVCSSDAEVGELASRMRRLPGVTVLDEVTARDFGGCDVTVRDHDGNLWTFGSYPGAPDPT